jgi:VIT1/CCC1 family predicted Fe2+/Mn2+ transporter
VVTLAVYWAAETYAQVLAILSERPGRLSRAEFGRIARTGFPMIGASFIPLLALLAAWALGADVATSAKFGLLVTTWMLFVIGWLTGRRSGFSGWRQVAATLLPGFLGLVLIMLKFQLH